MSNGQTSTYRVYTTTQQMLNLGFWVGLDFLAVAKFKLLEWLYRQSTVTVMSHNFLYVVFYIMIWSEPGFGHLVILRKWHTLWIIHPCFKLSHWKIIFYYQYLFTKGINRNHMQPWLCPTPNNMSNLLLPSLKQNEILFMIILQQVWTVAMTISSLSQHFQKAKILQGYASGWKQYFS